MQLIGLQAYHCETKRVKIISVYHQRHIILLTSSRSALMLMDDEEVGAALSSAHWINNLVNSVILIYLLN
jgi:hypothetical protein